MYEQFNSQFVNFGKQFADSALKANALALQNAERLLGLQVKTVESQLNANVGFFNEAIEATDFETAKAVWPKGVQLVKESAERFVAAGQEGLGQSIKTSEAIAELVRGSFPFEVPAAGARATKARAAKA
ncbi:MAG: phasin family protein [Rhodanobacteraceae bacterium]|nr:phasin family protein [Xanthomonadales bacterium]MCP5479604.1 phasin family protein [Rhodanobacteraceae bacterium]HRY00237.1 phasin family protein [Xanthomonadaceae bacterium]